MNLRNILLLTGLAVFLAGCVINPRPVSPRDYDQRYDDNYYDYRSTPSYEGYYYARVIFISNVPYYVDDDRYIRPIPPRLHDHFRTYPYNTLGHPPVFSRDAEVRDGYPVSHIIYLDGIPYHVGNDRIAQPLPERLHQHFRYTPANQGNAPANGNRPQPSGQHDNGRDRERIERPPFERGQHEGESKAPADSKGTTTSVPDQRKLPLRQDQPKAGEGQAATPSGKEHDLNGNRPRGIVDAIKMKADQKKPDQKKPDQKKPDQKKPDQKDKQGDSTKADDDSGNKKDNGKKPRKGKDDNQEGNDRGNGNRRD